MNVGTIFLITFLMTFFFCLKGAAVDHEVVCGTLGDSVLLKTSHPDVPESSIRWVKGSTRIVQISNRILKVKEAEKYDITSDGSLKIQRLVKDDAGHYQVEAHNITNNGKIFWFQKNFTLKVFEVLPQPQLLETCSPKTLICEVKYSKTPSISFKMLQNLKEVTKLQKPQYNNGTWKVELSGDLTGKYKCEVGNGISKQQTEKEISCPGPALQRLDMFVILCIGGGTFVLIIAVALLVYCIRKKRVERREVEAQERALHARINDEELKYRKLPQPPIHTAPSEPRHQQQRPLPPQSESQQQAGPPQPRPRPHQKPPRRMKEKPCNI